jgi:DNA-directed RNA polymerase subunit RPC12/RpoP
LPLQESTLYECPKCQEQFEAFTFGKVFECPFCGEVFEKIFKPPKGQRPENYVERMVVMRKR